MEKQPHRLELDISWITLFRVLALAVAIWAALALRDILLRLFVVFIFVAAVSPTVSRLEKHMPRFLAVAFVYSLMLGAFTLITFSFLPLFMSQVNNLIRELPSIVDKARPFVQSWQSGHHGSLVNQAIDNLDSSLNTLSRDLIGNTVHFFGGVVTVVTGLVLSFYLLLEEENARDFFHQVFPHHRFEAVYATVTKISERMGGWVRGQLFLMLVIAIFNFVGYSVIGISSPLPLALWSGICEVIPYVGPVLGLIPAVIVALTTGTILQAVLAFLICYLLIQQIEAHIVIPKVMSKVLGLSPVLVIIALLVGIKLLGLLGAVVAIPSAAIVSVIVGEWHELRKIWDSAPRSEL